MKNSLIRIVLIILLGIWIFGFASQIIFPDSPVLAVLKPLTQKVYSNVCHQDTNKLCNINGQETLVCARCAGIYSGLFLGIVLSLCFTTPLKLKFLVIASLLILFDVIFSTYEIYHYSKLLAFVTGLLFGVTLFLYIQDVIFKIFDKKV